MFAAAESDKFPDGYVTVQGTKTLKVEVTEADHEDRRRGDEYKDGGKAKERPTDDSEGVNVIAKELERVKTAYTRLPSREVAGLTAQRQPDKARSIGGSNITTMRLLPQRGQRNRLSRRDSGNARPRVHTSVSRSNSRR